MGKVKDLTGQRFHKLVALKCLGIKNHKSQWLCMCDCGNSIVVASDKLKSGNTKSCGCLKPQFVDLTGMIFGNLIVIKRMPNNKRGNAVWKCDCKCGSTVFAATDSLKNGNTQGCGCKSKETARIRSLNSHRRTRVYSIYNCMKQRCYNQNNKGYKNYGGRGIKICEEWLNDYAKFYDWAIKSGYKDDLTIDRIDVNGNYEPLNCKWSTCKEQNNNRRSSIYLSYQGKTQTIYDWSIETGIKYSKLLRRFHENWPPGKILNN